MSWAVTLFFLLICLFLVGVILVCVYKLLIDIAKLVGIYRGWKESIKNENPKNAAQNREEESANTTLNVYPYNHSYTQDDIIYKNGQFYENENSEDWEEFEYEISEDERFK